MRGCSRPFADWCDRYTPLVGLDPPDGLFLDITRLRASVRRRSGTVPRSDVEACGAGISHLRSLLPIRPAARWRVLARCASLTLRSFPRKRESRAFVARSVSCDFWVPAFAGTSGIEMLAPLPLAALRIDPDIAAPLAQAGLKTIGQLSRPAARAARRALQAGLRAPHRPGARQRGRADHPASAGAVLSRRAALRRADRPRRGCARHHPASRARTGTRDGAARQGRTAFADRAVSHRRQGGAHRDRHLRRRCAIPNASGGFSSIELATLGDEADPGFGFDVIRLSALSVERTRSGAGGIERRRLRRARSRI